MSGSRERAGVPGNAAPALVIADYGPDDDREALGLERRCPQGDTYRLSFRRETFDRRARNYEEWRLLVARHDERLVGTVGAAVKPVRLHGVARRAGFLFDLRVHPDYRSRGIAQRLGAAILAWVWERADLAYTYAVADNVIMRRIGALFGAGMAGAYAYLVYPTYRHARASVPVHSASFAEVHDAMRAHSVALELYTDPGCRPGKGGYVASWIHRRGAEVAGCSAWSNWGILGEVVERIPAPIAVVGRCLRAWPLRLYAWPHVPQAGEELRSWYVFDFFATCGEAARELMRSVETAAVEAGVHYCYVVHQRHDGWIRALRSDCPRLFAPTVHYVLLAGTAAGPLSPLGPVYVDIRDL